jgi:hypothetical protein
VAPETTGGTVPSPFSRNPEIGKSAKQIDAELDEVVEETMIRQANKLDVEDQAAREANLREARGQNN